MPCLRKDEFVEVRQVSVAKNFTARVVLAVHPAPLPPAAVLYPRRKSPLRLYALNSIT